MVTVDSLYESFDHDVLDIVLTAYPYLGITNTVIIDEDHNNVLQDIYKIKEFKEWVCNDKNKFERIVKICNRDFLILEKYINDYDKFYYKNSDRFSVKTLDSILTYCDEVIKDAETLLLDFICHVEDINQQELGFILIDNAVFKT